jgi:hypothetical protein
MSKLQEYRKAHPQYDGISDQKLSTALYRKHYSDMPYGEFRQKMGMSDISGPEQGTPEWQRQYDDAEAKKQQGYVDAERSEGVSKNVNRALLPLNAANRFGNAALLGLPDRVQAALMDGKDFITGDDRDRYAELKEQKNRLREQFPKTSLGADIGGSIAGFGKLQSAGAVPSSLIKGKGLKATTLGAAVDGAAISGANALIEGRGVGTSTAEGGLLSAGANVLLRGAGNAVQPLLRGKRPEAPTTKDLLSQASQTRKQLDDQGVVFAPSQLKELSRGITDELPVKGLDAVEGTALRSIKRLLKNQNKPATFDQLDKLRQKAVPNKVNATKAELRESGIIRSHIDDFMSSTTPAQGPSGLKGLLDDSRELTRRGRTAEAFEDVLVEARRNAGKSGTGGNFDNNLRQGVARVLKKNRKFMRPEEIEAAERLIHGTPGQNIARLVGRGLSPTTGALNALATTGAGLATGGWSIPVQAGGLGLKKGSEKITKGRLDDLIRQIQAGSKQAIARPETSVSKFVSDAEKQQQLAAVIGLIGAGGY